MVPTLIPYDQIKVVHLELTTRCQAACPQCDRMDPNSGYSKDFDLSLEQVKSLLSEDFVKQLDKVFACGTFGDPAAAKECLDIFRWLRKVNPNITLGINTNGGLRDARFWVALGELLSNERDYCVFSIDGMASTNDVYRKNVMWHRVMLNSEAFIKAGGRAHWDMLVFKHNEHHVDYCRDHAQKMGFVRFRTKVSNRFNEYPVTFLQPPTDFVADVVDGPIDCHAQNEQSIYISATGDILPCCFIGAEIFKMDKQLVHLTKNPAELAASWTSNPHQVCVRNCATCTNRTSFAQQFREETAFS